MPTQLTLLGLTFHLYGLILGIAVLIAITISERMYGSTPVRKKHFWDAIVWILGGVLVGARVWHVMTDWQLYQQNPIEAIYVWNGGLSIIGALLGGFVAASIFIYQSKGAVKLRELTDALVIGIPFGQAFGRVGNWINQELYGAPTNLPWKLFIDPAHRLTGYEKVEYYHPLFTYELLLMLIVGTGLWYCSKTVSFFKQGLGNLSLLYVAIYGWIRFFLEFLRIDKSTLGDGLLGINQSVMLVVAIVSTLYILKKSIIKKVM